MSYKREIGGEFWKHQLSACPDHAYNIAYLLSGRTALKFIIDDICQEADFRKILLPSYCCESMIKPFLTSGIEVQFYSVCNDHLDYQNYKYNTNREEHASWQQFDPNNF